MKKWVKASLALSLAATVAAGCGNEEEGAPAASASAGASPAASAEAKLAPAEITWYYPLSQLQSDQQTIQDEVNKITKEKLNATVKLMPVPIGDYVQKMNTVLAAGEKFDILWTGYLLKPEELVRKGAIQPLDDLLNKYAPALKKDVPQVMWDGLTTDDKIYGIPNQQINGNRLGFIIQKRYVDKYNLDPASIKNITDIEPFLEQIKQNEPGVIPFGSNFSSAVTGLNSEKYWVVPGLDDHFYVKKGDTSYTLLRYPQEDLDNFRLSTKWYKAGYIYKDAATAKMADFETKGQMAVIFNPVLKPGVETEVKVKNSGNEVITIPVTDWFSNGYSATTNQAISRTSSNPERAMMLLDLVNSDKTLYNLLCNGLEGVHYDKISDNVVKAKADSRYKPNMDWVFGSVFNSYLKEGQPADVWEQTKKINATPNVSPIGAFKFNSDPVSTEIANLNAVWGEYKKGLTTGTLDFDATWPAMYERLKKAGEDKYVAEVTKQFNEFLVKKGLKK
ncbi:MAG: transporter substrate-binding protein [Paenibacillaceae bacterium]|jgi:putative aldouronate transport system substrate-binding protein|nr:transporter substrate-binding protein [Paenibacillaceae bacterium]